MIYVALLSIIIYLSHDLRRYGVYTLPVPIKITEITYPMYVFPNTSTWTPQLYANNKYNLSFIIR